MAIPLANHSTHQLPVAAEHLAPSNLGDDARSYTEGYPTLAHFFSQCSRYLHLRRFSALAVRLLLYRQHHLITLEKELLKSEARDANSVDLDRNNFCRDFARLQNARFQDARPDSTPPTQDVLEQWELYETLKKEMKEYEEALLRFDHLGNKGYDVTELRTIQWVLNRPVGFAHPLTGVDASAWGSVKAPQDHASDMIQVVGRSNPNAVGRFLRNKFLLWAPQLLSWLWSLFFCSKKRPEPLRQYDFSSRVFDVVSLVLGNFVTSLLVYAAVTSLYFSNGKAASVAGIFAIASIITVCSILFRNQHFISMLATVCAVLVTLLLNDGQQHSQTTPTSLNSSVLFEPHR